jgi:hypothetical protein
MYVQADDVKDKIPISESVRKLEEAFPHLKDVKWNEKADLIARERKRKLERKKNVEVSE